MDDVMCQHCPDSPDVHRLVLSQVPLPSLLQLLEPIYSGSTSARHFCRQWCVFHLGQRDGMVQGRRSDNPVLQVLNIA
eukprot:6016753-Heterocapsa_arctica.AAC.1